MRASSIIALDVGGSSVKSGLLTRSGSALAISAVRQVSIDSSGSAESILATLQQVIAGYVNPADQQRIAIAFPGPFDYRNGICYIEGLAKYSAIYGLNLIDALHTFPDLAHLPIRFRNDAEAAIIGEALYGAGRGCSRLIGLTLGTGCGSAFLIDGIPQSGGSGVPANGWLYPVLYRGERADDLFSTRGFTARFAQAGLPTRNLIGQASYARAGSSDVQNVFASFGADLGQFLAPYVSMFKAEAVLILGGIASTFDLFGASLQQNLPIPVYTGQRGSTAPLYGLAIDL